MKTAFSKNTKKLAEHHARLGKVFCNPQRILIFWLLSDSEKTASEIAEAIGASRPRTSQHLLIMKSNKILTSRRDRKNIYYSVVGDTLLREYPALIRVSEDQDADRTRD